MEEKIKANGLGTNTNDKSSRYALSLDQHTAIKNKK